MMNWLSHSFSINMFRVDQSEQCCLSINKCTLLSLAVSLCLPWPPPGGECYPVIDGLCNLSPHIEQHMSRVSPAIRYLQSSHHAASDRIEILPSDSSVSSIY